MSDIAAFILAVSSHWVASMSGIVAIIAGAVQYLRKKTFHPLVWISIGIGCLFVASYQAWLDENTLRLKAECRVSRLDSARDQRRQFIKGNLTFFYMNAQNLFQRRIALNDFNSWNDELITFENRMTSWIKQNMGDLALTKITNLTGQITVYPHSVNDKHNTGLFALNLISDNLIILMQQPEWDQFIPGVSNDCR